MNKLNLFGKEWNNVVFEGRNKLYGAYKLRQESAKSTLLALVLGLGLVGMLFGGSHLYAARDFEKVIEIELPNDGLVDTTPIIEDWERPEPLIPEQAEDKSIAEVETPTSMADVRDNKKLTEAVVVKDNEVTESMTAQDEF